MDQLKQYLRLLKRHHFWLVSGVVAALGTASWLLTVKGLATDQAKQDSLNQAHQELQEKELKTIVVGIEDANCLAVLWNVGINFIQGYFLQEPDASLSYDFSDEVA